jgi:hypothetical protein
VRDQVILNRLHVGSHSASLHSLLERGMHGEGVGFQARAGSSDPAENSLAPPFVAMPQAMPRKYPTATVFVIEQAMVFDLYSCQPGSVIKKAFCAAGGAAVLGIFYFGRPASLPSGFFLAAAANASFVVAIFGGIEMLVNVKAALAARRMKQFELAAALRIAPSTLSEIVVGRREADAELRAKIAAVLGVEEAWLFQRVVPPRAAPRAVHAGDIRTPAVQI